MKFELLNSGKPLNKTPYSYFELGPQMFVSDQNHASIYTDYLENPIIFQEKDYAEDLANINNQKILQTHGLDSILYKNNPTNPKKTQVFTKFRASEKRHYTL